MISPDVTITIGQNITWGDPASPEIGKVVNMSQNGQIFFVERYHLYRDMTRFSTIERREIISVDTTTE